jgi:hypothetical protein
VNVLIACEFSGTVRDAFTARGHYAMSCDLLPTESPGPHYQGDVRDLLGEPWDLLIAHPPCTYLTNAGVRHLHSVPSKNGVLPKIHGAERWERMREGAALVRDLLQSSIARIGVENPVPHRYAVAEIGRKYDQIIQPWQFGHGETKATCLWLKGLPLLVPTNIVEGREARIHKMPPSADRWKLRSLTYPGIAAAMADQWGAA